MSRTSLSVALLWLLPAAALAQPSTPVEKWTGKTVLVIGAHADDDAQSHGTLALLQAHGNNVYIVTLTTGNCLPGATFATLPTPIPGRAYCSIPVTKTRTSDSSS